MSKKIYFYIIIVLSAISCEYNFPDADELNNYSLGGINAEVFVALGDDYLAGVMDGALYTEGQEASIPNIISHQLNKVNEISFNQPDILSDKGFNIFESDVNKIFGKWELSYQTQTSEKPILMLSEGEPISDYNGNIQELSNFSIPSLRIGLVQDPELSNNPFYGRMASSPGNSNLLDDAINRNPTFFAMWIGMNDILDFAINGATGNSNSEEVTSSLKTDGLTSADIFSEKLNSALDILMQDPERKGAIANILSVNDLPFFFVHTYDFMFLTQTISQARNRYRNFNMAVAEHNRNTDTEHQRPFIDFFDNGSNPHPQPLVVIDENLADAAYPNGEPLEKFRQLSKGEYVFLNVTEAKINEGYGSIIPLTENYYLSLPQIEAIESRIADYNRIINQKANQYSGRLVVVDMQSEIHKIAETAKVDAHGEFVSDEIIYANGVPIEGAIGANSIFSLDGLRFNARGNAFAAAAYITAINSNFKANIPLPDINTYKGNVYSIGY